MLIQKVLKMINRQIVNCPNCGNLAECTYRSDLDYVQTQCLVCDYLMIMCAKTYRVIEYYAPGIYPDFKKCSPLSMKFEVTVDN